MRGEREPLARRLRVRRPRARPRATRLPSDLAEHLVALLDDCASVGVRAQATRAALGRRCDLEPAEHEQAAAAVLSVEVLADRARRGLAEALSVVRVADREERAR